MAKIRRDNIVGSMPNILKTKSRQFVSINSNSMRIMKKNSLFSNSTSRAVSGRLRIFLSTIAVAGAAAASKIHAAIQTWTNAPADANWGNANNWISKTVPGAFVPGGGGQNNNVAVFNSALAGGIGGVANPITIDIFGTTNREVGSILFDTANCGAYVIGSPSGNILELTAAVNNSTKGSNITMTASVANPISFDGPVHFHFASSSNGGYALTNNATSSTAALYFDVLWSDSASSRPLTLTLAGSNTGTNTIRHIDDNSGANGSIHLIKADAGRWILPGPNDLPQKTSGGDGIPGNVLVNQGTLEVQDPASLGSITMPNLVVTNTGVLQIDNVTLNNTGITLRNGGTVRLNGSATINGIAMTSTYPGNNATLATTSASDVMTVGNGANTMTGGAMDSVLHISGPGTVLLSQPANYAGKWSVDSGTNQVAAQGALGTGPNLNVNAGAVFDTTPIGATTYALDTKGFSANGTGTAGGFDRRHRHG